jgi:sec-independent protein translocase protein TatB
MFDIGWQEIFILAVIALIVIGPKDLPGAVRTITRGLRKARSLARDLREGMDDVVREAEMDDLTKTLSGEGGDLTQQFKDAADLEFDDMGLDGDLENEMTSAAEDFKSITNLEASTEKSKTKKNKNNKKKEGQKSKKSKISRASKADGQ